MIASSNRLVIRAAALGLLAALLLDGYPAPAAGHHLPRRSQSEPRAAGQESPVPAAPSVPPPAEGRPSLRPAPDRDAPTFDPKRMYIANDDHSDYLWSADDLTYRSAFLTMLDYYMAQAEATAGNPPDQRGRFNPDGTIWVWEYERHKSPAEYNRLIEHVRAGNITVPLNALVQLYGAMPAEAVIRSFLYAGQLERRHNLRFPLVVPMENQTLPGGVGSLWAGCGALYAWKGICDCATQIDASNRPREIYRFTGPDGQSVIMKWNSSYGFGNQSIGGYAEARDPVNAVNILTSNPTYLARWSFDVRAAFGYGWDDLQSTTGAFVSTAQSMSDATQRVIVSNEVDFFQDFQTEYGGQLTTFGGSFGNEWELLTASMGEVTASVKRSVEKLRSGEALACLALLNDPAFMDGRAADRDSAMLCSGLYYEHSWTPGPGVNEATRAAWQRRIQAAITRYADGLYSDAVAAVGGRIEEPAGAERHYVFNPLSWTRTDCADLAAVMPAPRRVIDVSTGLEVPSQAITVDGQPRLRILASDVPAAGYRVYEVMAGAGQSFPASASVTLPAFENGYYRVSLGGRGQITSLLDKKDGGRQLVSPGAAIHDLGSGAGPVVLESSGPVSTTLRVVAGGTPAHETRVTLFAAPVDRIDIEGRVTQNFSANVGYASAFDLAGGTWRHEEVGMIARVARQSVGGDYADQNARTDYLTLNHFADLSQAARGVTLSSRDSQFFRVGNSTPTTLDATSTTFRAVVGMQVDGPGLGIGAQGGDTFFLNRYALKTHGAFDPASAMRMSLEHQNPLVAGACSGGAGSPLPGNNYSLLAIDGTDVLLWALKPAQDGPGQGFIVRAWNLAESPRPMTLRLNDADRRLAEARQVTHIETDIGPATATDSTLTASLARQEVKSWRVVLAPRQTGVGETSPAAGRMLALWPNPAPARVQRALRLTLSRPARVRLDVFDVGGRRVARVIDAEWPAGQREYTWTPEGLGPGVYFLRAVVGDRVERFRMTVSE